MSFGDEDDDETPAEVLARFVANGPTGTTQPLPAWRARITRGEDGQAVTLADVVSIDRHTIAAVLRTTADVLAPPVVSEAEPPGDVWQRLNQQVEQFQAATARMTMTPAAVVSPEPPPNVCAVYSPGGERRCRRRASIAHTFHSDGVYEWDGHGSIRPARAAYATLRAERDLPKGEGTPQDAQSPSGADRPLAYSDIRPRTAARALKDAIKDGERLRQERNEAQADLAVMTANRDTLREIVVTTRDMLRRHDADTNVHLAAAVEAVIADRDRLRAEVAGVRADFARHLEATDGELTAEQKAIAARDAAQRQCGRLRKRYAHVRGELALSQQRVRDLQAENERLAGELLAAREQLDSARSRTRLAETRARRCCDGHLVSVNRLGVERLRNWLMAPNGSFTPHDPDSRLTIDAVEHGGILVRTEPYRA